jgi:hypothetical protein
MSIEGYDWTGLIGLGMALLHVGLCGGLVIWARRLSKRSAWPGWKLATWVPVLVFFIPAIGLVLTVRGLFRAFDAVGQSDAAQRATVLSQGISEAMTWTAISFVVPLFVYLATAIVLAIGTISLRGVKTPAAS